jgi:hypothetical protein
MKKKPGKTGGKRQAKKPLVKDLAATKAKTVRGGASDLHFMKVVDKSSATL